MTILKYFFYIFSFSLLPAVFGLADPQRVCNSCFSALQPHQSGLTQIIANHARVNVIDVSTDCAPRRFLNLPYSSTLGSEIRKASYATHNLFTQEWIKDKSIPLQLLSTAKGLAFLTVIKGGFVFAPRVGTGLVLSRLPDGSWSAPSAICTIGCSWGALIGADITDYVIILNTDEAVTSFSGIGQISIGRCLNP